MKQFNIRFHLRMIQRRSDDYISQRMTNKTIRKYFIYYIYSDIFSVAISIRTHPRAFRFDGDNIENLILQIFAHVTLSISRSGTRQKIINMFKVDKNKIEQFCAAKNVHSCQEYCSALLHPVQTRQL